MKFSENTENKILFVANLLHNLDKIINCINFLEKLNENTLKTIFCLNKINKLNLDLSLIKELQLLVLYLRMSGGLDLEMVPKGSPEEIKNSLEFFLVNGIAEELNGFDYRKKDEIITKTIERFSEPEIRNSKYSKNFLINLVKHNNLVKGKFFLNTLVILTHNRPETLDKCLNAYIKNIEKFNHKGIKIIVSDDSDYSYSKQNKEIIENLRSEYPFIEHLDFSLRESFINNLIETAINNFPPVNANMFKYFIPYTFGGANFPGSYGRNRNFVSFYLKKQAYVCVDDDSLPQVLTYSHNLLKNTIGKMAENNFFDLSDIRRFIEGKSGDYQFIDVDFFGYFQNFNTSTLQYTRYSGIRDMNLIYYLVKELDFNMEEVDAFELFDQENPTEFKKFKKEFPFIVFLYKNRENFKPRMQGLCCYFPPDSDELRVTIPEKLRVEDLCLGNNYFLTTGKYPIETNFSIYHDKKTALESISPEEIHLEVISFILYDLYLQLSRQLKPDFKKMVFVLQEQLKTEKIVVPDKSFQFIEKQKEHIIGLLNKCLKVAIDKRDFQKAEKVKILLKEIKKEFFSKSNEKIRNEISSIINNVIQNYTECMVLWTILDSLNQ